MQLFKNRLEEVKFWSSFGYIDDEVIYCSMCEDVHENNSTCQGND